jgi:quinol-cytochrome oxidoreductase complex cytochrome b subunit
MALSLSLIFLPSILSLIFLFLAQFNKFFWIKAKQKQGKEQGTEIKKKDDEENEKFKTWFLMCFL